MRTILALFCALFCLLFSSPAFTQTPTTFQQQTQAAVSGGRTFSAMNLTATAEWIAGSDHETGTAQLQANVDGSTNVQLALGKASRTEVQTKTDTSRTCTWTDSAATSHEVLGPNCQIAIPWFAPGLFAQSSAVLPALLETTDDGVVSKDNSSFHQVSYLLKLTGASTSITDRMVKQSTVKVFYDPETHLPSSLEYSIHADNDDLKSVPVRVTFSNYQSASGVMLPMHIERFINHTLQLKLDLTNTSIQ